MTVRNRILGLYLLLCGAYQATLWFYFDPTLLMNPRVGLFFFVTNPERIGIIYWVTLAWLFAIAIAILTISTKPLLLVIYVTLEAALSLPTVLYVVFSLFGDLGHLTAGPAELLAIGTTLLFFSVVPCCLALITLRKTAQMNREKMQPQPS